MNEIILNTFQFCGKTYETVAHLEVRQQHEKATSNPETPERIKRRTYMREWMRRNRENARAYQRAYYRKKHPKADGTPVAINVVHS